MSSIFTRLEQYAKEFLLFVLDGRVYLYKKRQAPDDDAFVDSLLFLSVSVVLTAVLDTVNKPDQPSLLLYALSSLRSHVFPNVLFVLFLTTLVSSLLRLVGIATIGWRGFFVVHSYAYGVIVVVRSVWILMGQDSGGAENNYPGYDSAWSYYVVLLLCASAMTYYAAVSVRPVKDVRRKVGFAVVLLTSICLSGYAVSKAELNVDPDGKYAKHFFPATADVERAFNGVVVRYYRQLQEQDMEQESSRDNTKEDESGVELYPDTVSSGTLESGDELVGGKFQDVWTFVGEQGDHISVSVTSPNFDTYVRLRSPSGTVVMEDDDGGGDTDSQVAGTLEDSGGYEVVVTSFALAETGPYEVVVNSIAEIDFQPLQARRVPSAVVADSVVESDSEPPETLGAVPYSDFRDCLMCPEMVVVPAGTFAMGSDPRDRDGRTDEQPSRSVDVGAFAIGRYEVTKGEYATFVAETGRWPNGDGCVTVENDGSWGFDEQASWRVPGFEQSESHPIVCVSWEDARAYAEWLSDTAQGQYRLPSEAEWEYVARAGTTTLRYWGNESSDQCAYANGADIRAKQRFEQWMVADCDDQFEYTAPSGWYEPNPFTLFDMLGNVWEWVGDCWHESYDGAPSNGSPWTNEGGSCSRVARGGSWFDPPSRIRSAYRYPQPSTYRDVDIGFRVAKTLVSGEQ